MKFYSSRFIDPDDLLSIIKRQAVKAGWNVDFYGLMKSGDPRLGFQLQLSKSGLFFGLRSFAGFDPVSETLTTNSLVLGGVACHAKTGFDATLAYASQPGFQGGSKCYIEGMTGGVCYIFHAGNYFIVSTQFKNNSFTTLFFGQLPVIVAGTGGQCVSSTATYESDYAYPLFYSGAGTFLTRLSHSEFNGFDAARTVSSMSYPSVDGYPTYLSKSGSYGAVGTLTRAKLLNFGAPGLLPVNFFTAFANRLAPFAEFSDLFLVPLDYLEPGKSFNIGSKKFMAIPLLRKGGWVDRTTTFRNVGLAVMLDE